MNNSSFVEKVKEEKRAAEVSRIYLIRGNDSTGRAAWYYFQVDKAKKIRFEVESKRGQIQLTDYGKILISGYGEKPPDDVPHAHESGIRFRRVIRGDREHPDANTPLLSPPHGVGRGRTDRGLRRGKLLRSEGRNSGDHR